MTLGSALLFAVVGIALFGRPARQDRAAELFTYESGCFRTAVALDERRDLRILHVVLASGNDNERIGCVKALEVEAVLLG